MSSSGTRPGTSTATSRSSGAWCRAWNCSRHCREALARLGYYAKPEQHVPISSVRLAADVPMAERERLEVIRTDTPTFAALVESRRNRRDDWYKVPAGHIDLCNVPIAVRPMP